MFYIFDLYNRFTSKRTGVVLSTKNIARYSITADFCSININDIGCIGVGVFDSTDGSREYYDAWTLLNIVEKNKIDIEGIEITPLKRYEHGEWTFDDLSTIKSVKIWIVALDPSKDLFKSISKSRILGNQVLDIRRRLIKLLPEMVKDEVLYIPEGTLTVDVDSFTEPHSHFKSVYLPTGYNYTERYALRNVGTLLERELDYNLSGATIIFEDEIRVSSARISHVGYCNIHSNKRITYSKKDLEGYIFVSTYPLTRRRDGKIVISDPKKKIVLDLVNKIVVKV